MTSIEWLIKELSNYDDEIAYLYSKEIQQSKEIISELKDTDLWLMKFKAHLAGGHYYFKIDSDSEHDWHIVKSKTK